MIHSTVTTSLLFLLTTPFTLAAPVSDVATSAVPKGSILISDIINGVTGYYAAFHVGTPPQKEYLLVDTGSPTYSFEDPRSSWCASVNKPCAFYGTYDNKTSS